MDRLVSRNSEQICPPWPERAGHDECTRDRPATHSLLPSRGSTTLVELTPDVKRNYDKHINLTLLNDDRHFPRTCQSLRSKHKLDEAQNSPRAHQRLHPRKRRRTFSILSHGYVGWRSPKMSRYPRSAQPTFVIQQSPLSLIHI